MTRIGYLVHDLTDLAVHRRVAMLEAGGAEVAVAGLSRGAAVVPGAMVLGPSRDARLAARALRIAGLAVGARARIVAHLDAPDAIIARNLEMLALAVSLLPRFARRPRIVYECLDIHGLLVGAGPAAMAVRGIERALAPAVDLVLTSSPGFIRNHLGAVFGNRVALVENRVLDLEGRVPPPPLPPGPPWRIGWFGALRCRRSFDILAAVAALAAGNIEVVIRGRPSPAIFPDLAGMVAGRPHISFGGPYDPATLPALYGAVHFAWSIDLYEAGANSEWLLPNRLYESLQGGAVPIVRKGTEAAQVLARQKVGIVLEDAAPVTLIAAIAQLGAAGHAALAARQRALPRRFWAAGREDCADLVRLVADDPPDWAAEEVKP